MKSLAGIRFKTHLVSGGILELEATAFYKEGGRDKNQTAYHLNRS